MQRGLLDPEKVDPFSLFVESGGLTYCLYKDSERILGNTFGMCILQVGCSDFAYSKVYIILLYVAMPLLQVNAYSKYASTFVGL